MAALYSNNLAKKSSSNHLALFPAPTPSGKVLDFTTSPDTITVVRTSNLNHYIQPPSTPSSIRKDLTMTGVVVVHLSQPARVRKLRVSFVAEAVVAFPGRRWEDDVIFERTLEMEGSDEEGILLQAGPQLFEYTFVLPCTLPGFDRTPYGRVSHRVQATLIGQTPAISRLGSFFSSLRARSPSPSSGGGGGGGGSSSVLGGTSGSGFFGGTTTSGSATPCRSSSPTSIDGFPGSSHRGRSTPPGPNLPYQTNRSETRRSEVSPIGSRMGSPRAFTYTSPGIYEEEPPAFSIDDSGPPAFSSNAPERSVSAPGRARRADSMSLNTMTPKSTLSLSTGPSVPYFEGEMTGSKEMWIIPLATENLEALSLDLHRRSYIDGLGTLDWALASNAVCVGGLAKFWLRLDQLNPLATVWSVRLSITQTFSLKSFRRPEDDEHVFPATDVLMYRKGHLARNQAERYVLPNNNSMAVAVTTKPRDKTLDPLWEGEAVPSPDSGWGTEMVIAETVRFPDETRLRPSTIPGTITPIRVAHEFKIQIFFSIWGEDAEGKPLAQNGPGQMRKFMVTQPTLIMACCCTTGILALPTYAQSMTEAHPTSELECDVCACGQPLHELAEREIARDFMPGGPNGSSVPANSPGIDESGERGRTGYKSVYVPET